MRPSHTTSRPSSTNTCDHRPVTLMLLIANECISGLEQDIEMDMDASQVASESLAADTMLNHRQKAILGHAVRNPIWCLGFPECADGDGTVFGAESKSVGSGVENNSY